MVGSSLNGESLRRREALRGLRRMRAAPPGMAGQNAQRLRTFQAALEQAEQFLSSAESAGYETKPVFAFYALSQAGRAIAAASGHLTDDEYRPSGHGMRVLNTRDQADLWAAEVEVNKAGTPQSVARAMGSPMWPAKTKLTLAEIWPLVPETASEHPPSAVPSDFPALRYEAQGTSGAWEVAYLHGVPMTVFRQREDSSAVAKWLSHYPTLAGWQGGTSTHNRALPAIDWVGGELRMMLLWQRSRTHQSRQVDPAQWVRHAEQYRGGWWVLPAHAGMAQPVQAMVAWWAALLALSTFARYEPESWAAMIDVDNPGSPAVAIEHFLDTALDAIPELVGGALSYVSAFASDPYVAGQPPAP
ncbi:hypothetical protein GCM10023084_63900 [Streptomyces lacrimifluminis]|uniref:Uncharacterized protein n=2 Tax=Streptomyces lacrimifluminis TaxID=1500077 RepID=A0A917LBL0_9ACTN|nr:hypothetical protein GCM10012282_63550 [Streptomyces lacrimifluminis]